MMTIRKLREQLRMGRSIYDLSLRVTYYARVSTEKVEQQGSLENQVQYYTEFIQKNPNWTFVQGYVDEGISGTSTYKRESFLRMIDDAHRGLFDFIITKEISRFSRSTLDSIQYTQELLDANVGVLFQNDNINTLDTDSEFRLVVMAGVAQDEVRKLSERLKFGFRQSIKNGHVLGNNRLWGYDKKDCKLTIIPEQAEAVRLIFELYATGKYGIRKISQELTRRGHTSLLGNEFNQLTIKHILTNPKYKGWYCGNKTQSLDYRTKKKAFAAPMNGPRSESSPPITAVCIVATSALEPRWRIFAKSTVWNTGPEAEPSALSMTAIFCWSIKAVSRPPTMWRTKNFWSCPMALRRSSPSKTSRKRISTSMNLRDRRKHGEQAANRHGVQPEENLGSGLCAWELAAVLKNCRQDL